MGERERELAGLADGLAVYFDDEFPQAAEKSLTLTRDEVRLMRDVADEVATLRTRAEAAEAEVGRLRECATLAERDAQTWQSIATRAEEQRDEARAEVNRYRKREEHFARVLLVADRGQYRADWDSAIKRVVEERAAATARAEGAERDLAFLRVRANLWAEDATKTGWLLEEAESIANDALRVGLEAVERERERANAIAELLDIVRRDATRLRALAQPVGDEGLPSRRQEMDEAMEKLRAISKRIDDAARGCQHVGAVVEFDAEQARGLTPREVRRRWPRFFGTCPDCGNHLIKYASAEHYIAGDW